MTRRVLPPVARDQELVELGRLGMKLHEAQTRYVHVQLLAGVSWTSIGRLLGVSRQAATKRWSYLQREPVEVRWTATLGRRHSYLFSPRTGAVFGRLELDIAQSLGYVPIQSVRELLTAERAAELGFDSVASAAAELSLEQLVAGRRELVP